MKLKARGKFSTFKKMPKPPYTTPNAGESTKSMGEWIP